MKRFSALLFALIFSACATVPETAWKAKVQDQELIHQSVKTITDVIVHDIFSPPVASRIYTYMTVAGYECAIHTDKRFASLAGQLNGLTEVPKPEAGVEYSFEVSAIHAMLKVGKALIFSEDKVEAYYNSLMKTLEGSGIDDETFERSITYGDEVAAHIIAWSSKDNYKQMRSFPKYSVENNADTWRPTPPAYMDAIEPHWSKLRTFAIDSAGQFKPAPPTVFSVDKKSQFYKEAEEVYTITNSLTEEQKQIASFWDCNPFVMNVKGHVMFASKKISPGGHWMNITRVACTKANKSFAESAEAYVMVALALADGFISCWDEKYKSKVIRPETYINQHIDEEWTPLLQTPPFPEYTSGHSVISAASAVTLTKLFGDNFSFTDSTEIEFGLTARSFNSFVHASEEAAISRIYGGIHYRPAVVNGMTEGRLLGDFIVKKIRTRREEVASN